MLWKPWAGGVGVPPEVIRGKCQTLLPVCHSSRAHFPPNYCCKGPPVFIVCRLVSIEPSGYNRIPPVLEEVPGCTPSVSGQTKPQASGGDPGHGCVSSVPRADGTQGRSALWHWERGSLLGEVGSEGSPGAAARVLCGSEACSVLQSPSFHQARVPDTDCQVKTGKLKNWKLKQHCGQDGQVVFRVF